MTKYKIICFSCCLIFITSITFIPTITAQNRLTRDQYIQKYKEIAIREMNLFKIPASITLAQGIFESGDGNSELAINANNHFGIKCHGEHWKGEVYHYDDDEKNECFRKYDNSEQSYTDHSLFLTSRSRYASLFELKIDDYKGWAHGLKAAGYATLPTYAERLIKLIEENKLYEYDKYYGKDFAVEETPKETTDTNPHISIPEQNNDIYLWIDEYLKNNAKYLRTHTSGRKIYTLNNKNFIIATNKDAINNIALEFDLFNWQIRNYNDLKNREEINAKDIIYIEKKRNTSKTKTHTVIGGEDLWMISQLYGINLKKIYKKNHINESTILHPGQIIKL